MLFRRNCVFGPERWFFAWDSPRGVSSTPRYQSWPLFGPIRRFRRDQCGQGRIVDLPRGSLAVRPIFRCSLLTSANRRHFSLKPAEPKWFLLFSLSLEVTFLCCSLSVRYIRSLPFSFGFNCLQSANLNEKCKLPFYVPTLKCTGTVWTVGSR